MFTCFLPSYLKSSSLEAGTCSSDLQLPDSWVQADQHHDCSTCHSSQGTGQELTADSLQQLQTSTNKQQQSEGTQKKSWGVQGGVMGCQTGLWGESPLWLWTGHTMTYHDILCDAMWCHVMPSDTISYHVVHMMHWWTADAHHCTVLDVPCDTMWWGTNNLYTLEQTTHYVPWFCAAIGQNNIQLNLRQY